MKRKQNIIIIIVLILIMTGAQSFASSKENLGYERSEWTEHFKKYGKFDYEKAYELAIDEDSQYYDAVYYCNYSSEGLFDNYEIDLHAGVGDGIELTQNSNDSRSDNAELFLGVQGSYRDLFPVVSIRTKHMSKIVRVTIECENTYKIEFPNESNLSFVSGMASNAICVTMFDNAIDLLNELIETKMQFTVAVLYEDERLELYSYTGDNTEAAKIYYDFLKETNYIDKNDELSVDTGHYFTRIENAYKNKAALTINSEIPTKKYKTFSDKYGIKIIMTDNEVNIGRPRFKITVQNHTNDKTIDGYEIVYYGETVFGEIIELDSMETILMNSTIVKTIKPGKSATSDWITYASGHQPKRIYAAISRIHFTDGTKINVTLRDLCFHEIVFEY